MEINNQETASVMALSTSGRYAYFITKVADWEELYALKDNATGTYIFSEADDQKLISFWPAREFAEAFITPGDAAIGIREISLDEFEDKTVGIITENGCLLDIFPVDAKTGFVVSLEELARDLGSELEKQH